MIGSQEKKRAALSSKLKQLWDSGPEVSYNMNVRSGIFRVAVSDAEVTGFLDDKPIRSIKIEDLDGEIREALERNPEEAGQLIMEELINAHKEGKLAMSTDKISKEAKAGEGNGEAQLTSITEKQLEGGGPLYDRQNEERKDITEKQLASNSKEYANTGRKDEEQKSITEKQLKEGKNPNPNTSPREDKERDAITQKQLEAAGVSTRRDDEKTDITEKQLAKDFRSDEIKGITEKQLAGKEQKHDKVLIQRLASKEDALTFAKKVAKSTAHTLKTKELDKDSVIMLLKASVKNFSAQKKLAAKMAQMMNEELPPQDLDMEAPEDVAGDILADEEVGGSYDSDLVVNVLKSLVENPKFSELIEEAMAEDDAAEEEIPGDEDFMNDALSDEAPADGDMAPAMEGAEAGLASEGEDMAAMAPMASSDNDGLVAVEGSLEELKVTAGKEDLEKTAFAYSRKVAGKELDSNMEDFVFESDEKNGTYRAIFIDPKVANVNSKEVKELMAKREDSRLNKIASSLKKLETVAQSMPAGGGIPNMAPGGEPAGGGTTMPTGAPGAGMETPPVESFDTGEGEAGLEDEATDNEPSPPGTRCPVCGSDDVDVEKGNWECNGCQSNGEISISINVKEWAGTLEDNEGPNADEEGDLGEGDEIGADLGAGADLSGAPPAAPAMPLAASVYKINGNLIKEAVSSGKGYLRVGEHCPNCGSDNTDVDHVGNGKCFSCSQLYIAKIAHKNGEFKGLSIWQPVPVKPECPDCKAKTMGKKIAKKYAMKFTKKASKTDFPYEDCVNKIAKRYGLNAVALSGDCAGKSLIDCVCKKMKSANRYSQTLMMALASRLTEKDPMEECIEDKMRLASKKMTIKEACGECEQMRGQALMEMPEQEELEGVVSQDIGAESFGDAGNSGNGFGDDFGGGFDLSYDIDSFDNDEVSLSTEDKLLQQIQELLEVMKDFVGNKPTGNDDDTVDITFGDEGESDDSGFGSDDNSAPMGEIVEDVAFESDGDSDGNSDNGEEAETDQVEFAFDENNDDADGGSEVAEGDDDDGAEGDDDGAEGDEAEDNDDNGEEKEENDDDDDDMEKEGDEDEEKGDFEAEIESEEGSDKPAFGKEKKDKFPFEKGEKSANTNNDVINKVTDLDKVAREMSGKTIKRYVDTDVLKTADTMQINDILGDRKIGESASEKTVERVTSQDTKDIGKVKDGKTMGEEEKFDAKDPVVPQRGSASTMGEGEEMPEGKAKIPAGKGAMGTEKDTIEVEVSVEADGRVASVKKTKKVAGEKKVECPKPVDQSNDLKNQKLKDKQEMGAERETGLTPDTLVEPTVPRGDAKMGPDESKEFLTPSIPAGGGGMGSENETVGTEVSVETKGTVIARMEAQIKESEVKAERVKLATNLAALELMDGEIGQDEFDGEVSKLATSSVQTLKTLVERYQKQRAKKVMDSTKIARKEETVREAKSVGLETPFIIEKQAGNNLKDQIMGLFSLEKKIRDFEDNSK